MAVITVESEEKQPINEASILDKQFLKMIPGGNAWYIAGNGQLRPQTRPEGNNLIHQQRPVVHQQQNVSNQRASFQPQPTSNTFSFAAESVTDVPSNDSTAQNTNLTTNL